MKAEEKAMELYPIEDFPFREDAESQYKLRAAFLKGVEFANQQPEVDYQKMFANCNLPNEQPTKTVEERAFETGIRESANANDEFGYEAWFKVGVQTFSVSYIGTKEEAEAHRNMLETALTNIKGATDNQNK